MKKIILTFLFALIATFSFGQSPKMAPHFRAPIDITQYSVVDSLPLERIMIHFEKEIDNEDFISLGEGDYMAPIPHKDNMVIRTNENKDKAIIVYNSYCFGRHFEFNIEDNEVRTVYWYKDKSIYCGYIYDKRYKVVKYFESRKEFKRFMRRPFFSNKL